MKLAFLAVVFVTLSLLLVSCAASNPTEVTTPSMPASLDLGFAHALLDAQAAITTATGLVPATPSIKAPLNQIIASYNAAESAYLLYHASIAAGGTPDPAALSAQITALTNNVAALVTLFGGK